MYEQLQWVLMQETGELDKGTPVFWGNVNFIFFCQREIEVAEPSMEDVKGFGFLQSVLLHKNELYVN